MLPGVSACGMVVHQVVAERALDYFYQPGWWGDSTNSSLRQYRDILRNQTGALMPGSTAPDWLYACGSNHDDGEFTHWSPFQGYAANYIRQRYPLNASWPDAAQKLVAFMHGIVSHYIADLNWHSLGSVPQGYGFIPTIGLLDFGTEGLDPAPHTMADEGAEFVAAYETDLSFLSPQSWYVPVADLLAIYASAGRQVNASAINECTAIFYVGTLAVKYLAALVEPLEINKSPTLGERWIDLPLGGADDMSVWTGRLWTRWQGYLELGPPAVYPDGPGESLQHRRLHPTPTFALRPVMAALAPHMRADGLLVEEVDAESGVLKVDINKEGLNSALKKIQSEQTTTSAQSRRLLDAVLSGTASPTQLIDLQLGIYMTSLLRRLLALPSDRNASKSEASRPGRHWPDDARISGGDRGKALASRILGIPLARAASRKDAKAVGAVIELMRKSKDGSKGCPIRAMLALLDRWEALALQSLDASFPAKPSVEAQLKTTAVTPPVAVLASTNALEYAGSSLASADFDGDGLVDLAIGGYGYSFSQNGITPTAETASGAGNQPFLSQAGGFYIRYGGGKHEDPSTTGVLPLSNATDAVQHPATVFSRLGWSMCALDFNQDGVDDLAVSAPTQGWPGNWAPSFDGPTGPWEASFFYLGAVQIFLGRKGEGLQVSRDGSSLPDIAIVTATNETHTGTTLRCEDVDGDGAADLLVGSPMARNTNDTSDISTAERGRLDVFLSRERSSSSPSLLWLEDDADFSGVGESTGAWFGQSAEVVSPVAIQSPFVELLRQFGGQGAAIDDLNEDAALDLLLRRRPQCSLEAKALAALADGAAQGSLLFVGAPGTRVNGSSSAVGRLYSFLLPSAASKEFAGAWECFADRAEGAPRQLSSPFFTVTGSTTIDNTNPQGTASSKLAFALAAGRPLAPGNQQTVLAVSMPSAEFDAPGASWPSSAGGVLLWQLSNATSSLPRGDTSITTLLAQPMPGNGQGPYSVRALLAASGVGTNGSWPSPNRDDFSEARFGFTLGFQDINGDGVDDLIVGAPLYSQSFWLAPEPGAAENGLGSSDGIITLDSGRYVGAILVFKGGFQFVQGSVSNAESAASFRVQSRVQWGRLGYSSGSTSQRAAALMGRTQGASPLVLAPWLNETTLAVFAGAPRSAEPESGNANEMPGCVYVWNQPTF